MKTKTKAKREVRRVKIRVFLQGCKLKHVVTGELKSCVTSYTTVQLLFDPIFGVPASEHGFRFMAWRAS